MISQNSSGSLYGAFRRWHRQLLINPHDTPVIGRWQSCCRPAAGSCILRRRRPCWRSPGHGKSHRAPRLLLGLGLGLTRGSRFHGLAWAGRDTLTPRCLLSAACPPCLKVESQVWRETRCLIHHLSLSHS